MGKDVNNHLEKVYLEIETLAKAMIREEMPVVLDEDFSLFERTGNRLVFEEIYFLRRKFISVFGCYAILQKKERFQYNIEKKIIIEKLEKIIRNICEEECWALPAHIDRNNDTNWKTSIDLFAAETAETLSDLLNELEDELSIEIKELIKNNIERRIFIEFFESKKPYKSWEGCSHNWNAVCLGSIGSTCLHLLKDQEDRLMKYLERILQSLPYYIEGFAKDGTCLEGLGYYFYGMSYYANFSMELEEYTNGKIDLLTDLVEIATWWSKCFFSEGRTVNFSDGNSREKYQIGLATLLALKFPQVKIPSIEFVAMFQDDNCFRYLPLKLNIEYTYRYVEKMKKQKQKKSIEDKTSYMLVDAEWVISNAENSNFFACKGGNNEEPHNHNDLGSFIHGVKDEMVLVELGAGEYTKDYFNENRYHILCNSSFGHSVPIINRLGQKAGKEFKATNFQVTESKKDIHVGLNLEFAYEENIISKLRRTFDFSKINGNLIINDKFILSDKTEEIEEIFISQLPVKIIGEKVVIEHKYGQSTLIFEGSEFRVNLEKKEHANHYGEMEEVFLIRWKILDREEKKEVNKMINVKIKIEN